VSARAPGATAKDIPLLKLEVTSQRGKGQLTGTTTIQRINFEFIHARRSRLLS
jgi:hypothetical protein